MPCLIMVSPLLDRTCYNCYVKWKKKKLSIHRGYVALGVYQHYMLYFLTKEKKFTCFFHPSCQYE